MAQQLLTGGFSILVTAAAELAGHCRVVRPLVVAPQRGGGAQRYEQVAGGRAGAAACSQQHRRHRHGCPQCHSHQESVLAAKAPGSSGASCSAALQAAAVPGIKSALPAPAPTPPPGQQRTNLTLRRAHHRPRPCPPPHRPGPPRRLPAEWVLEPPDCFMPAWQGQGEKTRKAPWTWSFAGDTELALETYRGLGEVWCGPLSVLVAFGMS